MPENLAINEAVMLLALDDDEGRLRWEATPCLDYAIAGALLAELALRGLISLDDRGNLLANPAGDVPEHGLIHSTLARLRRAGTPRPVAFWVTELLQIDRLHERQIEELVTRGILEKHEEHFLFFFHRTTYPLHDRTPEKQLVAKVRAAVLSDDAISPRLAVIIALAHGSHLLRDILTDEELQTRDARLKEITRGTIIGKATCDLMLETERALYVASAVPFMGMPNG